MNLPRLLAALLLLLAATAARAEDYGRFVGRLILTDEAIDDCWGEDVDGFFSIFRLVEDFSFVDPDHTDWQVPSGTCVNGASIPGPFWSVIGGPWSGKYRRASVIHDHYVRVRTRGWQETHRVFYQGMLASGVSASQAKLMYYAVRRFGKRWDAPTRSLTPCDGTTGETCGAAPGVIVTTPEIPAGDISGLLQGLDFDALSLDEIDRIADDRFRAAEGP